MLGTAEVLWDSTGNSLATLFSDLVCDHDKAVAANRAALGDQAYAAAFRRGKQMPLADALDNAKSTRHSTDRRMQTPAG